jgi:hypothetical protein
MSGNGVLVFSVHKLKHHEQKIRTKNENKNQIIKFIKVLNFSFLFLNVMTLLINVTYEA